MKFKRFGFTLAEVLVVISVIGVIAALTVPTLIANTGTTKFRTQFKKTLYTLNQAGMMSKANHNFDYGNVKKCNYTSDNPENSNTICALFNGTLSAHSITTQAPSGYTPTGNVTSSAEGKIPSGMPILASWRHYLTLADGSMVVFDKNMSNCQLPPGMGLTYDKETSTPDGKTKIVKALTLNRSCYGFIDVNGPSLPNKEVTCSDAATSTYNVLNCTVPNNATNSTDIYPIVFHDGIVEPATNAAISVLKEESNSELKNYN